MERDRRWPIGARVVWHEEGRQYQGTVLRHGRDAEGVYTEVRSPQWPGVVRLHRSMLRGDPSQPPTAARRRQ